MIDEKAIDYLRRCIDGDLGRRCSANTETSCVEILYELRMRILRDR